jgi:hypothetical protein
MQGYESILVSMEHNSLAMCNIFAKMMGHIEVMEDNFERMLSGGDALVPSDIFRVGDWFGQVMRPLMTKNTPDD